MVSPVSKRSGPAGVAIVVGLVVLVAPVVGFVGVVLADLVPDRWVVAELHDAIERGEISSSNYGPAVTGHQIDYFTDCIGITIGLGDRPGSNRWTSAIRTPTLGNCEAAVPAVERWAQGEGLTGGWEYFRYWHGYTVATRPGLAAVGLDGTRVLATVALVGVALGLARSLARAHGPWVGVAAVAPLLLTTDLLELGRSLPHAAGATAAIAMAWWAHRTVLADTTPVWIAMAATAAGAVFVFADILTMPPGAWALTVFVVGLAASRLWSGVALAGRVALAAGCWAVGWAAMWVWKWLLAATVYGPGRVRDTIEYTADLRLAAPNDTLDPSFLNATRAALSAWRSQPMTAVVLLVLGLGVAMALFGRRPGAGRSSRMGDRLLLVAPAVLPILWFEVLRNHTLSHSWFVYRSLGVSAGVVAAALLVELTPAPRPDVETVSATPPGRS